jgi:hypothetical protein
MGDLSLKLLLNPNIFGGFVYRNSLIITVLCICFKKTAMFCWIDFVPLPRHYCILYTMLKKIVVAE